MEQVLANSNPPFFDGGFNEQEEYLIERKEIEIKHLEHTN